MGFFDELFEAVVDLPAKLVEMPVKVMERALCLGDHNWGSWQRFGSKHIRYCRDCEKKETA